MIRWLKGFTSNTCSGTGDSLKRGTSVGAYYIGKFLNGHVFDTNVADSALKYRIYSDEKNYTLFDVMIPAADDDDKKSDDEESAIAGFVKCMQEMRYGEQAICFSLRLRIQRIRKFSIFTGKFVPGGWNSCVYAALFLDFSTTKGLNKVF